MNTILHRMTFGGLLVACFVTILSAPSMALGQTTEDAVASGKDALTSGSKPPWYDSSSDSVRRITIEQPPVSSRSGNSSSDGAFGAILLEIMIWLAWIFVGLVFLALIALLVYAILMSERSLDGRAIGERPAAPSAAKISALPFSIDLPPEDLLQAARKCYEQGDYRRCVILLYSHLLLEMDHWQVIHLTRGKTNRQYVREAAARPSLAQYLELTMLLFEPVFFGGHALERRQLDRAWTRLDDFHAQLREAKA